MPRSAPPKPILPPLVAVLPRLEPRPRGPVPPPPQLYTAFQPAPCEICIMRTLPAPLCWQEYTYTEHDPATGAAFAWTWAIPRAEGVIRALRQRDPAFQEPVEFPRDQLREWFTRNEFNHEHLDHLPAWVINEPGILATVLNSQGDEIQVLIDGTHRGARALRDGYPFHVWILNREESELCLIGRPE